jgi:transporter family protein
VALLYAIIAAVGFGVFMAFEKQASTHLNELFGAILVSAVAALIGMLIFIPQIKGSQLVSSGKGWLLIGVAGLGAFIIDYFSLLAYAKGLSISLGGPIIIGGGIAVAVLVGLFLGEKITLLTGLGFQLVISGASILAAAGK